MHFPVADVLVEQVEVGTLYAVSYWGGGAGGPGFIVERSRPAESQGVKLGLPDQLPFFAAETGKRNNRAYYGVPSG